MTHSRALAMAHISVFLMGVAAVFAEVSGFEAWRTTSYRVTFGAAVLLVFMLMRRRLRLPAPKRSLLFLGLGFLLSIHWFAFFRSIELLGVILGSAMLGFEPVIIAVAARLMLGEKVPKRTLWAMGISLIGFVMLGSGQQEHSSELIRGVSWSIFAFLTFAILVVANRKFVSSESPLTLTFLEMLGAIPLAVIMTGADWAPADSASWVYALILGLLCTGAAYVLYNTSMQVLSAPVAGLLLSLEVVYGMGGGYLIGDSISGRQALAALFIANILFWDIWQFLRKRGQ